MFCNFLDFNASSQASPRRRLARKRGRLETLESRWPLSVSPIYADVSIDDSYVSYESGIVLDDVLYFSGETRHDQIGQEFMKYDPSANGGLGQASPIADINLGSGDGSNTSNFSSNPSNFVTMNGKVYFTAETFDSWIDVYEYDPAANEGAGQLRRVYDLPTTFTFDEMEALSGKLYFSGDDGEHGYELWELDLTSEGGIPSVRMLADFFVGTSGSVPMMLTAHNSKLYYMAKNDSIGYAMWSFNPADDGGQGTIAFEVDVTQTHHPPNQEYLVNEEMVVIDDTLYFREKHGSDANEVWAYNTNTQTARVIDIREGHYGSEPQYFTVLNDRLYVTAKKGTQFELWQFDPHVGEHGTLTLLTDANGFRPEDTYAYNGRLYFNVGTDSGDDLWEYVPGPAGSVGETNLVFDFSSYFNGPSTFIELDGLLYFDAYVLELGNPNYGYFLHRFDPNPPPQTMSDTYLVAEDSSLAVTTGGVLDNDSDPDGATLTVTLETLPQFGVVQLNEDGTFTYTPHENFSGTDTFTYLASDGGTGQAIGHVTITVEPTPDAAVIAGDLSATITEDHGTLQAGQLTVTDPDEGESEFQPQTDVPAEYGIFQLEANGDWTYQLDPEKVQHLNLGDTASETHLVRAQDGTAHELTINIQGANDAPTVAFDSISEAPVVGQPIDVMVLADDVDNANETLTYTLEVFQGDNPQPIEVQSGTHQTQWSVVTQITGVYTLSLTVTDANNESSTVQKTIIVGNSSSLDFLFTTDASLPGAINSEVTAPSGMFHEWEDATGQIWFTLGNDLPPRPIDVEFQITSTANRFLAPHLINALGEDRPWVHSQEDTTITSTATLQNVDLSEYQPGDRVLLATVIFSQNLENVAGMRVDVEGQYITPANTHGVQLENARILDTNRAIAVQEEVPGNFGPVIYDTNDDGKIGLRDFADFIREYGKSVGPENGAAYRFDFNRDGKVGLTDFAYFIRNYGARKAETSNLSFPESYLDVPESEPEPPSVTLEGEFPVTSFVESPQVLLSDWDSDFLKREETAKTARDSIQENTAPVQPLMANRTEEELRILDAVFQQIDSDRDLSATAADDHAPDLRSQRIER
ncbi:VCBS domain-containing protein [Bremerella alba]|uniref:EF-hand domain-containing protein n=1 Tax=Bremerella alba TaxID=980252 RepID=A0A7V8V3B0_9BACT|nr:VCBS domain-containing protein [Bremerella alba]MBA2114106.1 hypothetical protein [Bremerella alba]